MKIMFVDEQDEAKEYETKDQDLKSIFQIADNLSDTELAKMQNTILEITKDKNYDR